MINIVINSRNQDTENLQEQHCNSYKDQLISKMDKQLTQRINQTQQEYEPVYKLLEDESRKSLPMMQHNFDATKRSKSVISQRKDTDEYSNKQLQQQMMDQYIDRQSKSSNSQHLGASRGSLQESVKNRLKKKYGGNVHLLNYNLEQKQDNEF